MIHGKIDTEGLEFEVIMADVAELNAMAFNQQLDITKLSFHAYAYMRDFYHLLDAGSALGNNCGPLLISKAPMTESEINQATIAIPGKYTTANFLLSLAYPNAKNKKEVLFSEIENMVVNGTADAGLIIHENRFTYESKGLVKIIDLGEYWESSTQLPIPLGGIVALKSHTDEMLAKIDRVLRRSVEHALQNPDSPLPFIQEHAQEMDTKVMYQHINLYVNDYTVSLGEKGHKAVEVMMEEGKVKGLLE